MTTYTKAQYAVLKGVSRARISQLLLIGLKTTEVLGQVMVIDCKANDDMFSNPAHNRKGQKKELLP